MFASLGPRPQTSITFLSTKSLQPGGLAHTYQLQKRLEPVKDCRNIGKRHMKFNDRMPKMRVDPETYTVEADGVVCKAEPAEVLPLTQAYFIY
jgi:urease